MELDYDFYSAGRKEDWDRFEKPFHVLDDIFLKISKNTGYSIDKNYHGVPGRELRNGEKEFHQYFYIHIDSFNNSSCRIGYQVSAHIDGTGFGTDYCKVKILEKDFPISDLVKITEELIMENILEMNKLVFDDLLPWKEGQAEGNRLYEEGKEK